jgi:pimeloyl-ACP methyl ester carboxylesterase
MHSHSAETVKDFRPLAELIPADWQPGSITAADGAPIHYLRTGGQKPPLLLLHGIQGCGAMWLRTAKALGDTYDLIMPDFRGHGHSSRLTQPLAATTLTDDLASLLEQLGIANPALAGHSMGADIAGRLAARVPTRAVVLVDPALQDFMGGMPVDLASAPWMQPIFAAMRQLQNQSHHEQLVTGLRLLPPGTPAWEEHDYVSFVAAHALFDLTAYQSAPTMGYLFAAPEIIGQIAAPILLLTARSMFPGAQREAGIAAFSENWRSGTQIAFPDSGHFIPFDQFERFIAVVRQFLGA